MSTYATIASATEQAVDVVIKELGSCSGQWQEELRRALAKVIAKHAEICAVEHMATNPRPTRSRGPSSSR